MRIIWFSKLESWPQNSSIQGEFSHRKFTIKAMNSKPLKFYTPNFTEILLWISRYSLLHHSSLSVKRKGMNFISQVRRRKRHFKHKKFHIKRKFSIKLNLSGKAQLHKTEKSRLNFNR